VYGSISLLLPFLELPSELSRFLIDSESELSATELRLHREGAYSQSAAKHIASRIQTAAAQRVLHVEHLRDVELAICAAKSQAF